MTLNFKYIDGEFLIYTNNRDEQFVLVSRDGVELYVREDDIPGGVDCAQAFVDGLMQLELHEMLDDLLTSRHDGGYSATSEPESFLDEFFLSGKEKYGSRLRFDYFEIERLQDGDPRQGTLAINFSRRWLKGSRETPAELSIAIELRYPSVALYMPRAYPSPWLMEFFRELEACDDSFDAIQVAFNYSETEDTVWRVGLPKRDYEEISMTSCMGTLFLQNCFTESHLNYFKKIRKADEVGQEVEKFSWGNQLNPVSIAIEIQESQSLIPHLWFKERMEILGEAAQDISFAGDLGL
ncbi:hypothetical protein [Pseudomonas sp. S10E 269]|uniref:hypothetical protein n=1 Tax=Pseudomonas sp. S10E 269 TaxID=2054917 RepID=UPI0012FD4666|nr:hypothetical protein [Pseudomonas sp. S10E 269]